MSITANTRITFRGAHVLREAAFPLPKTAQALAGGIAAGAGIG
ncbi:hypothetical protein [Naasia sp. SYSU D00057]|nr:hypothetical protein [Naasia sp. SYSU D00057]